jgi:hypothetical protein
MEILIVVSIVIAASIHLCRILKKNLKGGGACGCDSKNSCRGRCP